MSGIIQFKKLIQFKKPNFCNYMKKMYNDR